MTDYEIAPSIENTKTATLIHPTVTARQKSGTLVSVGTRSHRWIIDVLKLVADAIGFDYSDVEIECEGTADMRGARGVKGVRPYFTSVQMTIRLTTDEDARRLELLRRNVEQRCPVMTLFESADVEMDVTWQIIQKGTA